MSARTVVSFFTYVAVGGLVACAPWHRSGGDGTASGAPLACRIGSPQVRWVETPDERDQAELAEWCATVGPAVVQDFRGANGVSAIDSLVVIGWNTHVGAADLIGFVERLREGRFTGGRPLSHFILLLQEVHRAGEVIPVEPTNVDLPKRIEGTPPSGDRLDIIEVARELELAVFYAPSMRNGPPGRGETEEDRGNAILSTLTLEDLTAIELPLQRFRRVAVAATVRGVSASGKPWRLRACSVHLDTRAGFPRYFASAGAGRLNQAKALVEALPEVPAVLGGDFNSWAPRPIERTIPFLRRHFPHPEALAPKGTMSIRFFPDRRVDYLLFNASETGRARYRRLDERWGSDHFPLMGWIKFGP